LLSWDGVAAVDVLILTYLPDLALARCIGSVTGLDSVRVVVAVNNDRSIVAGAIDPLRAQWADDRVTFIDLGKNWGYAEGINRGLAHCSATYVLLLNDDAIMTDGALMTLLRVLDAQPATVAGVGPKTLLVRPERVIDNVGAGVHAAGFVCNRGVGEIDIGQYDSLGVHPVVGLCFAAALIRRSTFENIGLLDSSYFMYAEDSEWCLRAKAHGFTFLAVPEAIVLHDHSLSTRTQAADFKDWLIRRNSFLTAAALLPARTAARVLVQVVTEESAALVSYRGGLRLVRHVLDLTSRAPRTALRRARLQRVVRRNRTATAMLAGGADCRAHNDVAKDGRIVPKVDRATLIAMYRRRGGKIDQHVVRLLEQASTENLEIMVKPLIAPDGPEVADLLHAIISAEQGRLTGVL
jgi:GT2 family glycosyltransferase